MRAIVAVFLAVTGCAENDVPSERPLGGRRLLDAGRIELNGHRDGQPYVFERAAPGRFRVLAPIRDLAAPAVLADIARAWEGAELRAPRAVGAEKLRTLQLDPPIAFLEADFGDERVRVELGTATAKDADTVWARVGERVFVAPMALLTSLQFEQEKLRAERIFIQRLEELSEVVVEAPAGDGALAPVAAATRNADGWRWRVQPPGDAGEAAVFAAAAAELARTGLRYGASVERGAPDFVVRVTGEHGEERLHVHRLPDRRLVGRQEHRDLEVDLPARSVLFGAR